MILCQLTNGFGNNLFQYNASIVLGKELDKEIFAIPPSTSYYAIDCLKRCGVQFYEGGESDLGLVFHVNDPTYMDAIDKKPNADTFILKGYFEDYRFFIENIEYLKSVYPKVKKRYDKDLVIQFRAGDRLFYKNEFDYKPRVESYINAIKQFDFSRLHIVTDMPEWDYIDEDKLSNMSFHYDVPYNHRVAPNLSVDYFNSFVDGFKQFDPVVQNRTVYEDFNFIRSFDNILFEHGTMSWWAAILSDASKVGVYGPWRAWKGHSNKNLSKIPLENWFQWQ